MSRLLAIEPDAIERREHVSLLKALIGFQKPFFLARFPPNLIKCFQKNAKQLDSSTAKKLLELLAFLKSEGLVYGERDFKYRVQDDFVTNATKALIEMKDLECVLIKDRVENHNGFISISEPDDYEKLYELGPKSFKGRFKDVEHVWAYLKYYLHGAKKVALVGRNYHLINGIGKSTLFASHLRKLLQETDGNLGELIIYARYDPKKDEHQSRENLHKSLRNALLEVNNPERGSLTLPSHGLRYVVLCEDSTITDLHERLIVTNHVTLTMSDELGGGTKSQSIRVADVGQMNKENYLKWLDGEHGLSAMFDIRLTNIKSHD